nr:MAG TPA_asm: hypothetical protein [Caudoviricetes sp.]
MSNSSAKQRNLLLLMTRKTDITIRFPAVKIVSAYITS